MTEKYWKAVTSHGSSYTYEGGSVLIDSPKHGKRYFHVSLGMKVIDREALAKVETAEGWKMLREAPYAEVPEVGKALYLFNMSEWQLSSTVVALTTWDPKDENG